MRGRPTPSAPKRIGFALLGALLLTGGAAIGATIGPGPGAMLFDPPLSYLSSAPEPAPAARAAEVLPQIADASGGAALAPMWRVAWIAGNVSVETGGQAIAVEPGAVLPYDTEIETGRNGQIALMQAGSQVTLLPKTTLVIRSPGENGLWSRVQQLVGTALYKVKKQGKPHFQIETPHLVAVVKGTEFSIVAESGQASVHVSSGKVSVSAVGGADSVDVEGNESVSVNAEGTATKTSRSESPSAATGEPTADTQGSSTDGAAPQNGGGSDGAAGGGTGSGGGDGDNDGDDGGSGGDDDGGDDDGGDDGGGDDDGDDD
jgi:uncharacterized membrane protein YgcG